MKKIYTTKHCLTDGIKVYGWDGEISGGYVSPEIKNKHFFIFKLGFDAFLTEEEAKVNAEEKRKRKITSLQKQIARIESIKF